MNIVHPTENLHDGVVARLRDATNAHDLDSVVACFAVGYRNETPAHPARAFTGRDQVRRNWEQIFAAVPDIETELVRCSVDASTVWSEWEHRGTRRDGTAHLMRGVIIFGVADDVIAWARFYVEPVQNDSQGIDEVVRRQVSKDVRA